MLIDSAEVTLSGGNGGAGKVSFGKKKHSGPDGGNGGKGGDLYMVAKSDLTLLNQFSREHFFSAENGDPGGQDKMFGKNGKDITLSIPVGTSIVDKKSGKILFEFTHTGQTELVCKGGKGGLGNWELRSPANTTPKTAGPWEAGERRHVILNLRLIADYGLIGLPNAGKSSLLNELTKAKAKTANYPFTTLTPNLGVFEGKVIADIPGLIEGAAKGKGLGISFLKHIEKVKVLLHCISSESEDVIKDYETIRKELSGYNEKLINKTEIILLTKSDTLTPEALNTKKAFFKKLPVRVLPVSIHDWESLEELRKILRNI